MLSYKRSSLHGLEVPWDIKMSKKRLNFRPRASQNQFFALRAFRVRFIKKTYLIDPYYFEIPHNFCLIKITVGVSVRSIIKYARQKK